jgi:ATP-dependent exoDNAse (exonuclease V) alpha subunit
MRTDECLGMKVMVTLNLATEADLANGSWGTIEDIILDPREQLSKEDIDAHGIVWTKYPLAMIVFRPFHHEFEPFPGFMPGLIPLFPSEVKFNIHDSKNPKSQIHRRQFALVAGYAFTDHKVQGQTIENVIVDIGPTKRFSVDAFAAYMALSQSWGRETIRLLRDFDDKIFTTHPSEHLHAEDERLAALSLQTKIRFVAGAYEY